MYDVRTIAVNGTVALTERFAHLHQAIDRYDTLKAAYPGREVELYDGWTKRVEYRFTPAAITEARAVWFPEVER